MFSAVASIIICGTKKIIKSESDTLNISFEDKSMIKMDVEYYYDVQQFFQPRLLTFFE